MSFFDEIYADPDLPHRLLVQDKGIVHFAALKLKDNK